MMLTLIFLRFIGEKYENGVAHLRTQLIEDGLDPDDENIISAFFDDATFTDGTYNLPPKARWNMIINTPAPGLNVLLIRPCVVCNYDSCSQRLLHRGYIYPAQFSRE